MSQFSYKTDWFKPVLAVSIAGHFIFFGGYNLFFSEPQYAVKQAPSSMEIIIVNETKKVKKIEEKVITTRKEQAEKKVIQKEEKKEEKKIQKPVYTPPKKGAITKALPDYLKNPAPVYPAYAKEQGWQGLTILEVEVKTDGSAGDVKLVESSGYRILDRAAIKAVKKWRFHPAKIGNVAFASKVKIPVRFVLTEL